MLTTDFALYTVATSFTSATTILPAFAEHLGASNVVIGLIPALATFGFNVPGLFMANHTEAMAMKKRLVVRGTSAERLPWLLMAIFTIALGETQRQLTLALLIGTLVVVTTAGGLLMPAWVDLISQSLPAQLRGRFFAFGSVVGGLLAIGSAVAATQILERLPFPENFGACFAAGFVVLVPSWIALGLVHESPKVTDRRAAPIGDYIRRIRAVLRDNRPFAWYLASRAIGLLGGMASGFYVVFAIKILAVPEWQVGVFTGVVVVAQTAGSLLLGFVGDRIGHRAVMALGFLATALGNVALLVEPNLFTDELAFACLGFTNAALNVSALNVLVDFAPEHERATYVGLGTTSVSPFAMAAPILAGLLLDGTGFSGLFLLAGIASVIAFGVLTLRVRGGHRLSSPAV